jgi:hypothetical protein
MSVSVFREAIKAHREEGSCPLCAARVACPEVWALASKAEAEEIRAAAVPLPPLPEEAAASSIC